MNHLRRIRRSFDLTQQQLADETNLSKSYICDLEKGNILNPSVYKCYVISDFLGCTISQVFPKKS